MAPALLALSVLTLIAAGWPRAGAARRRVLPPRVDRIVLHTLGGPFYGQPDMRWVFFSPAETLRRWSRPTFGAHWIVATDGAIWPRHTAAGDARRRSALPVGSSGASGRGAARRRHRLPPRARGRSGLLPRGGRQLAHGGHRARALGPARRPVPEGAGPRPGLARVVAPPDVRRPPRARDVLGHKDLDRKPAYVGDRCRGAACAAYADPEGRPYRRRVDPPEALFQALAREGLTGAARVERRRPRAGESRGHPEGRGSGHAPRRHEDREAMSQPETRTAPDFTMRERSPDRGRPRRLQGRARRPGARASRPPHRGLRGLPGAPARRGRPGSPPEAGPEGRGPSPLRRAAPPCSWV